MAAGSVGLCATSCSNVTVSIGNTTWNFTTITVSPVDPFSPQEEARNEQPDFVCVPIKQQQHAPCFCVSREQQHW
jgi:hypothetical protein